MHYGDNEAMKDHYVYAPGLILGILNPEDPRVIVLCCDSSYSKSLVFSTHWNVVHRQSNEESNDLSSEPRCHCASLPNDTRKG